MDASIAGTGNGDDELRKERKRRRAERRRKQAQASQRSKGSRGRLRKTLAVELTPREQEISRRWSR